MRKRKMTPEKIAQAQILIDDQRSPTYIAERLQVSRQLIHRYIKSGMLTDK